MLQTIKTPPAVPLKDRRAHARFREKVRNIDVLYRRIVNCGYHAGDFSGKPQSKTRPAPGDVEKFDATFRSEGAEFFVNRPFRYSCSLGGKVRMPVDVQIECLFVRVETRREVIENFNQRRHLPDDIRGGFDHAK